jgi:hypothetical protein
MSSGISFVHCYPPTAQPSSSKARCSSPSPLSDGSRVKLELASPCFNAYEAFPAHCEREVASAADTDCELVTNETLISPPSAYRHYRPPTLLPTAHRNPNAAALFPQQFVQPIHHPQHDVLPLLNSSFTNDLPETVGQHGTSQPSSEQLPPSRTPIVSHGSVNSSPWTSSHPVFTTTSALAAHHGIPQSLPPVPRTTRYLSEKRPAVPSTSTNSDFDFSTLMSDYLNMLSQKPEESHSQASSGAAMTDDNAEALQAVLEVIQGICVVDCPSPASSYASRSVIASPEFQQLNEFGMTSDKAGDYNSFLTSPMEDSPYEDMLTTPALGSGDFDYLTSPAIVDADDFGYGSDEPLFGQSAVYFGTTVESVKAAPPMPAVHHPIDFDGMYTISPETPALDPSSLHTSPLATPITPSLDTPVSAPRRKNAPTGTRKNLVPEDLVPYDAPIQPRKYVTPSSTSRKTVPAGFAKKRARSQAFGKDDEDELADEDNLDTGDLNAIEAKRRQNTLAARRSRKRKLEYQRELEMNVDRLSDEVSAWKRRSETLEAVLRSHGLEVPPSSF